MRARLIQIEDERRVTKTHLSDDDLVIGRDVSADLVLDHARVSRRHAVVQCTDEGYVLYDLGSSNGTSVNGQRISDPVLLHAGDVIELGDELMLVFEMERLGGGFLRMAPIGAVTVALVVLAFWLWPGEDRVMQEATTLAAEGVEAHERGDALRAKEKLNAAVGLLFARGRLDDVPRRRVMKVGLRRLGERLDGSVNLVDIFHSAIEGARPSKEVLRKDTGLRKGPCRLDRIASADLNVCVRERAEQVLFGLWQDPSKIPESFYRAVNQQLRLLMEHQRDWVEASLKRGESYAAMMERELEAANMPPLLNYLPMIESGYQPRIRSKAGARGMWQFMPATARAYGLEVKSNVDERTDPDKSTRAAARYLRDLAFEFGGDAMLLAIASYNKGENGIRRALKKLDDARTDRSYWTLVERNLLPKETRDYVPRFVAAAVLGEAGVPPVSALTAEP
jgi:hypothetical protein